jgi:hypothetical protein
MVTSLALLLALAASPYQHLGPTPPPHGLPAITSYAIETTDIRAGQTISGSVETSANVDYVEARIDYRNAPMKQTSPGHFVLSYKVPWYLPPWLRHGYTLQIVARSIDGVETTRDIPIRIH